MSKTNRALDWNGERKKEAKKEKTICNFENGPKIHANVLHHIHSNTITMSYNIYVCVCMPLISGCVIWAKAKKINK